MNKYKTILKFARTEIVEKKSRFISSVKPIANEEEAINFINQIKKEFYDARHHVYAYQIGDRNEIQRCSDDGEPSGTSGPPTLDVLKGKDIKNTVIVTSRYFGGTLLGTGGLVRAYGKSASTAILEACIVDKILFDKFYLTCDYTLSGKITYILKEESIDILNTIYTDTVTYEILVEVSKSNNFINSLINVTNNNVTVNKIDTMFYTVYEDKILIHENN